MKRKISLIIMLALVFMMTGCIKRDSMEGITIDTTNYPIQYITKRIYGKFSKIQSIYPNGANIDDYSLTDKQIKDFSEADLYIFNGLSKEKDYLNKMRKNNKELKIIDTTLYMEFTNDMSELWLDPSNFLMMAQNIKAGLNEYIDSYYLNSKIEENYNKLKIEASNLDAEIKDIVSKGSTNVLVTSNKMFKFLEKYGLTVYVLDESDTDIQITTNEVIKLIRAGTVKYIFVKNNEEENSIIKNLMANYGVQVQKWHTLENLSEIEISEKKDYFSIMKENLELMKNELYK
ncbi:MAG: zinc ABC transporter substrate-binding protein [Bacilli bacterium]|nr:zinc ABC transporter substrate-binding protein [Bacilli bacterium]